MGEGIFDKQVLPIGECSEQARYESQRTEKQVQRVADATPHQESRMERRLELLFLSLLLKLAITRREQGLLTDANPRETQ